MERKARAKLISNFFFVRFNGLNDNVEAYQVDASDGGRNQETYNFSVLNYYDFFQINFFMLFMLWCFICLALGIQFTFQFGRSFERSIFFPSSICIREEGSLTIVTTIKQ